MRDPKFEAGETTTLGSIHKYEFALKAVTNFLFL